MHHSKHWCNSAMLAYYSLLLFPGLIKAMQCYVCNSSEQSSCSERINPMRPSLLPVNCAVADARFCVKTTGVYGGLVGINRFCSSLNMGTQCTYVSFPDHDRIYRACIYTCSKDACNEGMINWKQRTRSLFALPFLNVLWRLSGETGILQR
ncbi:putative conserved secreted protein [Fasciola gigantica]|uniref:Putative conserved secreted protein n=1 Tax=Fasciola gigantica TaxID=46835 RepID=A0A504YUD3_FASGI|nr:putative conserved secreted protein [Fasciola gigantica]